MPIQIGAITEGDFKSVKAALEKIASEAQSLQDPHSSLNNAGTAPMDALYTDKVPLAANLQEGKFLFYVNGATIRIYTKINNVVRYWNLT